MENKGRRSSAMQANDAPLSEPEIAPCLFVTGAAVDVTMGVVRLIIWNHVPNIDGQTEERRIVSRVAMPEAVAHGLYSQLHDLFFRDTMHGGLRR